MNRFYISVLLGLKYFPVFNFDCYFEKYDDSPLEDYTLYHVRKVGDEYVYPFYRNDLCYGMHLKLVSRNNYVIHDMMRPSSLQENQLPELFKEIYASDLPDSHKKDIGNILCGLITQKSQAIHKGYFSTSLPEVRFFEQELGGWHFPINDDSTEVGFIWTKTIRKPLVNGFYPIALLMFSETHYKMHELIERLEEFDLKPFAINTDCIYHAIDDEKYALFKTKYHDEYFNYVDKNDFNAIGKLKYETKPNNSWSVNEHIYKEFDFDFSVPTTKNIEIRDEWKLDEFIDAIENHRTLFLFGHGGFGKSSSILRACKEMGKKVLILAKAHALVDKWYAGREDEAYNVMTVESFFRLGPYKDIPFGYISKQHLEGIYAIIFDDFLLYDDRITKQILLMIYDFNNRYQDLKFIGNGDPLQLNNFFSDKYQSYSNVHQPKYQKLIQICSNIFVNIITLKENKRLRSIEDRNSNNEFLDICKREDKDAFLAFAHKHMNVITDKFKAPKDLRHVIVAENRERKIFDNMCFAREYGTYTSRFQVGHIVLAETSMNCKKLHFGRFQQFIITEKTDTGISLQNRWDERHVLKDLKHEFFHKNFKLPYARSAHIWQGDTCDEKILIYGIHHNYLEFDWIYTACSRATAFKNIWILLDTKFEESQIHRIDHQNRVDAYYQQDIDRFGVAPSKENFITVEWILKQLIQDKYTCKFCKENMSETWTIDRLNNILPHTKSNSHLCCLSCNRAKK